MLSTSPSSPGQCNPRPQTHENGREEIIESGEPMHLTGGRFTNTDVMLNDFFCFGGGEEEVCHQNRNFHEKSLVLMKTKNLGVFIFFFSGSKIVFQPALFTC